MFNRSLWVVEDKKVQEKLVKYANNTRVFPEGSFIYQQEDDRKYMYFLTDGRIRVSVASHDGTEKTLAIHEPGSFFGETAFFDRFPSFTCAQALKQSTVLCFGNDEITLLMKEQPDVIYHMFDSLGRKIRLLAFQVEYLSFMNIEERIVALLVTLFESFSSECSISTTSSKSKCNNSGDCPNGRCLKLTITDQEIGEMIGARREAVTKAIANLKKQNLINKQKRMLCSPDIQMLNKFLTRSN